MAKYIKLYRSIRNTPMYRDPPFFKFWVNCMFEASIEPWDTHTLDGLITIQPGQFIASSDRSFLYKYNYPELARYRLTWERMWHYLKVMRDHGYITIDTHRHGTHTFHIVTVVGWDKYYQIESDTQKNGHA